MTEEGVFEDKVLIFFLWDKENVGWILRVGKRMEDGGRRRKQFFWRLIKGNEDWYA